MSTCSVFASVGKASMIEDYSGSSQWIANAQRFDMHCDLATMMLLCCLCCGGCPQAVVRVNLVEHIVLSSVAVYRPA
jgi:L-lactate utilization protein LutB